MARDKAQIIANTQEMLGWARSGLADATGSDPRRRRAGWANLVNHGRHLTNAMQTMKSADPGFAAWWKPYQGMMSTDPLMKFFNKARVGTVHTGELKTSPVTYIGSLDSGELMRKLGDSAPPNSVGLFLGDELGGNGWRVQMPDGSIESVYFDLPESIDVTSWLTVSDAPDQHEGKPITDKSLANLGGLYLATLERMVSEFSARFSP